jgi:hypothetical protein
MPTASGAGKRSGSVPPAGAGVTDKVISVLDAAIADPANSAAVIAAVKAWLAQHSGSGYTSTAGSLARNRPNSFAGSVATSAQRLTSSSGLAHRKSSPSRQGTQLTSSMSAPSHPSASAAVAAATLTTWLRLFSTQATQALRSLSSLTTLVRVRIECLTNLADLAIQAGAELGPATMTPEHPFVKTCLTLLPLVAYQLKANQLGTTKPALRVLNALVTVLGTYVAPVGTQLTKSLLEAWIAPAHVTIQNDMYGVIELLAGSMPDAPPVLEPLISFWDAADPITHAKPRQLAAGLAFKLVDATMQGHSNVTRLKVIQHRSKVATTPVVLPVGMPIELAREAIAASLSVEPEFITLVPAGDLSKPGNAVDLAETSGAMMLLAAHPYAARDSGYPSRPPSPIPVTVPTISIGRVRTPPAPIEVMNETQSKKVEAIDEAGSPNALDHTAAEFDPSTDSPLAVPETARREAKTYHTGREGEKDAYDDSFMVPLVRTRMEAEEDALGSFSRQDSIRRRDVRDQSETPSSSEHCGSAIPAAMLLAASGGAEGRLRVSVTTLWRMFLEALTPQEQEMAFPCLYVLFPHEVTELFNASTVPVPPTDSATPTPKPLTDKRRADIMRSLAYGYTTFIVFTPLAMGRGTFMTQATLVGPRLAMQSIRAPAASTSSRQNARTSVEQALAMLTSVTTGSGGSVVTYARRRSVSPMRDGHAPAHLDPASLDDGSCAPTPHARVGSMSVERPPLMPLPHTPSMSVPRPSAAATSCSGSIMGDATAPLHDRSANPSGGGVRLTDLVRRRSRTVMDGVPPFAGQNISPDFEDQEPLLAPGGEPQVHLGLPRGSGLGTSAVSVKSTSVIDGIRRR